MKKFLVCLSMLGTVLALPMVGHVQPPKKAAGDKPAPENLFAGLKVKRLPLEYPQNPGSNLKTQRMIVNETMAELEERALAYSYGAETEAGLLDVLDRTITQAENIFGQSAGAQRQIFSNGSYLRWEIFSDLSKFGEAARKTMLKRTQDNKVNASRARADLHRARTLCMKINLVLWNNGAPLTSNAGKFIPVPKEVAPVP